MKKSGLMKKAICCLLCMAMVFSAVLEGYAADSEYGSSEFILSDDVSYGDVMTDSISSYAADTTLQGSGTKEDPYLIKSEADFSEISKNPDKYFKLNNDINITISATGLTPIGTYEAPFTGVFDGNNHTIKDLKIKEPVLVDKDGTTEIKGVGLFGKSSGCIMNLKVEGATITGTENYTSVLVAYNLGKVYNITETGSAVTGAGHTSIIASINGEDADIRKCTTSGIITSTGNDNGAIVATNNGIVVGCESESTVTGYARTGGLAGTNKGIIEDCKSSGMVSYNRISGLDDYIGSFIGYNESGAEIKHCTSTGGVSVIHARTVGGFAGQNDGTIEYCQAEGKVDGTIPMYSYVGGFCGKNTDSIVKCVAKGAVDVKGNDTTWSGGFAGYNSGTIRYCASFGNVTSVSIPFSGGFVGGTYGSSMITNCYSLGNVESYNMMVGSFAGSSKFGIISYCYAAGTLTSTSYPGDSYKKGFTFEAGATIANCYYDKDNSGCSDTGNGEAKSTAEMKNQSTYTGFNFTSNWVIDAGKNNGYPHLKWEDETYTPVSGVSIKDAEGTEISEKTINKDETLQLQAVVAPDNATTKTVKWKSSNESIATVSATGLVSAKRGGECTITVTTDSGHYKSTVKLTVTAPKYTVTFETDGGTVIPAVEIYEGDPVSRPEPDPVKSGLVFGGWYKENAFTTLWDFDNDTVSANMTLYACWRSDVSIAVQDATYTGSAIIPKVTITNNNTNAVLAEGTDYTLTAINNINAAAKDSENPPTVTIEYKGTYKGRESRTFTIKPYSVEGSAITVEADSGEEDGSGLQVSVFFNGTKLVKDTDYTYTIDKYYETVTVTGKGNFTSEKQFPVNGAKISPISDCTYTGSPVKPDVKITYRGRTLREKEDYDITYSNNINAAKSTDENAPAVKISYYYVSGQESASFTILPYDITGSKISATASNTSYTGSEVTTDVSVTFNEKTLKAGTDYTVTYSDNIQAGTAIAHITGIGNFTGTTDAEFTILLPDSLKKSITGTQAISPKPQPYTGGEIRPMIEVRDGSTVLKYGRDYELEYYDNIKVGKAGIIIVGIGNYTGRKNVQFTIVKRNLNDNDVIIGEISTRTFTGFAIKPGVSISIDGNYLVEGVDYKLSYSNNKNATSVSGKPATVKITGMGGCSGTRKTQFNISTASFSSNYDLYTVVSDAQYKKGKPVYCKVEIMDGEYKLKKGVDYTLTYRNNREISLSTDYSYNQPAVTITGKGNYAGAQMDRYFRIYKTVIGKMTVSKVPVQMYTGSSIQPTVSVTAKGKKLVRGADYSVTYGVNRNAGKGTIYITGLGSYGGVKKVTFTIKKRALTDVPARIEEVGTYTYIGGKIKPNIRVVDKNGNWLTKGKDYTVTYKNNTKVAGVADSKAPTVIVTGKGNYKGTLKTKFTIAQASLLSENNPDINIKVDDGVYKDGMSVIPNVTITDGAYVLKNGKDYFVTANNNTQIAEDGPTVTITGRGNYTSESVTIPFRIATYAITGAKVDKLSNESYTGEPITPRVNVTYKGTALIEGVDYRLDYGENIFKGTGYVYITGMGGYAGAKTVKFKIK